MRWKLPWLRDSVESSPRQEEQIPPDLKIRVVLGEYLEFHLETWDNLHPLSGNKFQGGGPSDFASLAEEIVDWLGDRRREGDPEEAERQLGDFGHGLAKRVLPQELRYALESVGEEIQSLQILSAELWFPWELLKLSSDPDASFLAERFALTRWPPGSRSHLFLPLRNIRILSDESIAAEEGPMVLDRFKRDGRKARSVEVRSPAIRQALAEEGVDGWHVSCHASSAKGLKGGALHLGRPGPKLSPETFCQAIERNAGAAPLIFLNACYTTRITQTSLGPRGWAEGLPKAGAGAFIGTLWAIPSRPAQAFAQHFYDLFLAGVPLAEAARQARLALRREFAGDPSRLAYAVFGHPLARSADSPTHDSGDQQERTSYFDACFTLLRVLEHPNSRGMLMLETASRQAVDQPWRVLSIRREDGPSERWLLHDGEQSLAVHLRVLRSAEENSPGVEFLGSVQSGGIGKGTTNEAAALFEGARTAGPDDTQNHTLLIAGSPVLRLVGEELLVEDTTQRSVRELIDSLKRFHLQGYELSTLQARILALWRRQGDHRPLGLSYPALRFDYRLGPALTHLRKRRGKAVSLELLQALLFPPILASSGRELSMVELDEGLARLHESNEKLLRQPILEGELHIESLYVAPCGRWVPRAPAPWGAPQPVEPIADLGRWMLDELLCSDRSFFLLLGDFGHGKTTLARRLTHDLSRRRAEHEAIPVFITLRDYRPDRSLRDILTEALLPFFPVSDALWAGRQWVLVLDGFDELGILHQESESWLRYRFSGILEEARRPNMRVVLTSRPTLFLDPQLGRSLVEGLDRLELLAFESEQVGEWLERWSRVHREITLQVLKEGGLLEVARTPVLLLMIAMMLSDRQLTCPVRNRSDIYKQFFNWTERRGGLDLGLQTSPRGEKHRTPDNYRDILRYIAWLLTCHPEAKGGLLHIDILLAETRRHFHRESSTRVPSFDQRLFVAHAFREGRPEHLEFLHQSLREYLVAERLCELYTHYRRKWNLWPPEDCLAVPVPTPATLHFFRQLIESLPVQEREHLCDNPWGWDSWATLCQRLVEGHLSHEMPHFIRTHDGQIKTVQRSFPVIRAVAITTLLGFLFELYLYGSMGRIGAELLRQGAELAAFLGSERTLGDHLNLFRRAWSDLQLRKISTRSLDFSHLDLSRTLFELCSLEDCTFYRTNLSAARFRGSDLADAERSTLIQCRFEETVWETVELEGVAFEDCHFVGVQATSGLRSKGVVFQRCHFDGCVLPDELFESSRFIACTFIDTRVATRYGSLRGCLSWNGEDWLNSMD